MITKYFQEHGLKIVTEVTDSRFTMVDDGGVPCEDGELLYAFIRRLKPQMILETGTYSGISSLYMAQAVKDNGFGHVQTVEYEQFHIDRAQKLWGTMGVFNYVTVIKSDSLQFTPDRQYQFMFLDTEMNMRLYETVRFFPYLDEGGYIFIHDMPNSLCKGNTNLDHPGYVNWPVGKFPLEFDEFLKQDKLRLFHFMGGRGMAGFYKPTKDDYKF